MATKKATASKSTSSRTSAAAKKTTVKKKAVATRATATKAVKPASIATIKVETKESLFPVNLPNIILAELIGTFILTIVAFAAFAISPYMASQVKLFSNWLIDPLFIGLTLTLLVFGIGTISGAHVNPAVTFGLWVARKVKTVMVPVYWLSQFLGALLAVGVLNVMTNGQFVINISNFTQLNLPLFFIELIGMAIFVFGIVAVVSRETLSDGAKAIGVGLSLAIALVATTSMLSTVQASTMKDFDAQKADIQKKATALSDSQSSAMNDLKKQYDELKPGRPVFVNAGVLNPAVALAVNENGFDPQADQKKAAGITTETPVVSSRFGLEVILGNLVGAAVGAGLYLLMTYRPKNEL